MGFIPGVDLEGATTEGIPTTTTILPTRPTGLDLLVQVTATVVNSNFDEYYPGVPIDDSKPNCFPLEDGSLVCPPLIKDLLQVHAILIICSALFIFFFRNTFTVVRYIRSGKVSHKALFYILLGSHIIGFVYPLPTLISVFIKWVDCRLWVVKSLVTQVSNVELSHS